jgi:hypothetical protein
MVIFTDISRESNSLLTLSLDFTGYRFSGIPADIVNHYLSTLTGEGKGNPSPDTTTGAGDNRYLSLKTVTHSISPFVISIFNGFQNELSNVKNIKLRLGGCFSHVYCSYAGRAGCGYILNTRA